MLSFIITLIIIAALLLILVVLAQNSKGGGLSSQFGGSTSQVMGVKRTGDLLEKLTWGLAISIMILSLSTHIFLKENIANPGMTSPTLERAEEQTILPPANSTFPADESETNDSENNGLDGLVDDSL